MFSDSKHLFSKNLKHNHSNDDEDLQWNSDWFILGRTWWLPLSQQEVVGFDVGVDDAGGVQLLRHVQDAGCEVHDERLRHHLVAQGFIDVHCVLRRRGVSVSKRR